MKPLYLGCRKINPAAQGKELEIEHASRAKKAECNQASKDFEGHHMTIN